ncbi:MAG: hypothetical protein ABI443_08830 [Chthoniobacterales bacterium]
MEDKHQIISFADQLNTQPNGFDGCERVSKGGKTFVFLASLFHHATGHQVLEFFVGTETKHFLSTARSITLTKPFMNNFEQLLEFERRVLFRES